MSSKISVDLDDQLEVLSQTPSGDPHKLLFLAVIFQAMLDATKPEADNESAEAVLERDRAKGWLFATVGVTAADFVTVCDLALNGLLTLEPVEHVFDLSSPNDRRVMLRPHVACQPDDVPDLLG